jgi:hypothetical protein
MSQLNAMLLSIAVEASVAYLIARATGWVGRGAWHVAAAVAIATAATHPQLWDGVLWLYGRVSYLTGSILAEFVVIVVEALIIAWGARLDVGRAFLLSAAANGSSVLVGLLLPV